VRAQEEQGFIWLLIIPVILVVAFAIHQVTHHNEADSDHLRPAVELGCGGGICSASPIPEPGSLVLLGAGGIAVGWAIRRRY